MSWLACLFLAGCAVGPDYRAPDLAGRLPAQYGNTDSSVSPAAVPDDWWKMFKDPALDTLVQRALANSPDLAAADANIRQARAALAMVAGGQAPQLNASGRISRDQLSRNSEAFANIPYPNAQTLFTDYRAGFDASWEIDLFGHTARGIEAAQARLGSVEEQRSDVALRVAAEVARNVIDYRAWQMRIDNGTVMLDNSREVLRLVRLQEAAGMASSSDVAQAQNALHGAAAVLPPLEAARQAALAALGVLVDQPLAEIAAELQRPAPIPVPNGPAPVGLPGELLQRRPDVRMAERQLAAASADIGVAVAEQYPRLTLIGYGGWDSIKPGTFVDQASQFWNLGTQLTLPLFSGGRLQAQVDGRSAARDAALAGYRKAILAALADTETALIRYQRERARLNELEQARAARLRQVELADQRYRLGETSMLELIDARQQLAGLEDQRLASQQALADNLAALFKALGGGFGQI
jgi:NodT family efflux transporter outer membrane factor (OMF) lipoprotein